MYAPSAAGQAKALAAGVRAGGGLAGDGRAGRGARDRDEGRRRDRAGGAEPRSIARRGPRDAWCALGSVKSQIGHTKAAAGAAGLIKAALALHHKVLPPTIKVDRPLEAAAPGRSPFYVNTEPRPGCRGAEHPRRAAVSAFGFGGSNFHCVLEEAEPEKAGDRLGRRRADPRLLGRRPERVARRARRLAARPGAGTQLRREAARSRAPFQAEDAYRLLLVVDAARTDRPGARLARRRLGARGRQAARGIAGAAEADLLRQGSAAGRAGDALPRPGVAVRRHAPRAGLPVPPDARRAGAGPNDAAPATAAAWLAT